MQGFVYNTRRPVFADRRVREALGYAFDFEWTNKNLFYGAYTRTKSYFSNSDLASRDLPSREELRILEPFRGKVPDEVFTKATSRRRPTAPARSGRICGSPSAFSSRRAGSSAAASSSTRAPGSR